jgi:Zn-dependent peptidase ImmA (M78 family)
MRFFIQKLSELNFGWNRKPLGESEFYGLCRRFSIKVTEMPLRTDGFYYRVMGRDYIAVNRDLPEQIKLLLLFHELGHFLFHTPESGATANFHGAGGCDRKEREADTFALCALIPMPMLHAQSVADILDHSGLPEEKVVERLRVLSRYGI